MNKIFIKCNIKNLTKEKDDAYKKNEQQTHLFKLSFSFN